MKKQILYTAPPLLLVLSLLGIMACRKDEPPQDCPPDLPCATQYGANTFGCYIDGVPWVAGVAPYVFDPSAHPIEAEHDETGYGQDYYSQFRLSARSIDSSGYQFWSISFRPLKDTITMTEYNYNFDNLSVEAKIIVGNQGNKTYVIDTLSPYIIKVHKYNTEKGVISGLFNFKMISKSGEDTIIITNGRFDVKYISF
jgi:hypothetical protein